MKLTKTHYLVGAGIAGLALALYGANQGWFSAAAPGTSGENKSGLFSFRKNGGASDSVAKQTCYHRYFLGYNNKKVYEVTAYSYGKCPDIVSNGSLGAVVMGMEMVGSKQSTEFNIPTYIGKIIDQFQFANKGMILKIRTKSIC